MNKRTKKTILVSHRIFPETLAALSKVGRVLAPNPSERFTKARLEQLALRADAFVAFMPDAVDESWLAKAPKLRIVAGALKGYDNFDVEACTRRGVWVSNVKDLLTVPTSELTIGLMISLARNVRPGDVLVRRQGDSRWRPKLYGMGISGSTVGLIGMGMIGVAIAKRLQGFGANLLYFDKRPIEPKVASRLKLKRCTFRKLLATSDILIVALPLNAQSHHLLDDDAFATCKRGVLLINPARGSVVDEMAVLRALENGQLGGYAADVFECEDLSVQNRLERIHPRLLAHPNTLYTPHLGSAVHDVRRAIELRAAANVSDWASGRPPRDALNRPAEAAI